MDNAPKQRSRSIAGIIEYFMHPALTLESDRRHRARILIVSLLFIVVMMTATAAAVMVTPFPSVAKMIAALIAMAFAVISAYLLYSLRRHGNYLFCSMTVVVADLTSIVVAILCFGGSASPAIQLLAFPALMGYFFGGVRWGSLTAIVSLLVVVLLTVLDHAGVEFYVFSDPARADESTLFGSLVGLIATSGMAYIYEYTSAMLKRERDVEEANVNRLAHTDALTGLANRFSFEIELQTRIDVAMRPLSHRFFSLCYLDLDGFKPINDRYGHEVGDEILRVVSERLSQALRNSDYVGRQGGDEFVLILDAVRDLQQLQIIAERLLHILGAPVPTCVGSLRVGASLGFASFPDHASGTDELRHAADQAMYVAKHESRGWYCFEPAAHRAPQQN